MKAAIVGLGKMGQLHARTARSLGIEVVTVDNDPSKGADYSRLRDVSHADMAVIALRPQHLAEVAVEAAQRGMDVLVEKPVATDLGDALFLADVADWHGVRVEVGFTNRYDPLTRGVFDILPSIGEPHAVLARRTGPDPGYGITPMLDLGIHDHDLIRLFGLSHVHTEIDAHYAPARERTMVVIGSEGTLKVDWHAGVVNAITRDDVIVHKRLPGDPLTREWTAFLARRGRAIHEAIPTIAAALEVGVPA